jgi:predicted CXXCH cytochrome family protein
VKPDAGVTTQVYGVSYLHYAPSFATLFGNDSAMVPTYPEKEYAGRFVHPYTADGVAGATEFGCVDCHNVHDTQDHNVIENKMYNPDYVCSGCHGPGAFVDAEVLQARTVAYGQALFDTILSVYNTRFDPDITADDLEFIISSRGEDSEIGANDLAVAASIFKIFNYEDGSPHGVMHGHGGSWAHNSKFARQLQYDAIQALGDPLEVLDELVEPEGPITRP